MKLTEKEKNAIVNEALFNLGTYFVSDDRDFFVDCEVMESVVYALIEEIWEPETKMETTVFGLASVPTEEDVENLNYMEETILDFISSHGEVRDWLLDIIKENQLQSLYEDAYEILNYEYFESKEAQKKALEPVEKRIKQLTADAEAMKEAWDCFKKIKYGNKSFNMFF